MGLKYSVIVPIYGVEQYIRQCVDSIINQTYSNIEIILVDDGSKDSCPQICDEYAKKDNRIIVIHKQNGGLVSARKAGAKRATGDYVCCVDGDDYIDINYIEEIDKIVFNKNFDIVCCGYHQAMPEKMIDVKVNVRAGVYDRKSIEEEIFPNLIQNDKGSFFLPTVWAKAIKRQLYLKYQLLVPDGVSMGEDGACTIPCIVNANSIFISEECLYYYRFNPKSITKSKKPLEWEGQLQIARHLANVVDLSVCDFEKQYFRRIERGFITVTKSQFNRKESYRTIKKEILEKMKDPIFREAIEKADFNKGMLIRVADFALKHRVIFLFRIAGRI